MYAETARALRRNDPSRWHKALSRRNDAALPFDADALRRGAAVLLDTMVYTDMLRGSLPPAVKALLDRALVFHSAVARAELALNIAILDPRHPETAVVRALLEGILTRMAGLRLIAPSTSAWTDAGLLAGILARLQGYKAGDRRRIFNDALLLMAAREHGLTLLSRNVKDMDLLTQLRPDAKLMLYR